MKSSIGIENVYKFYKYSKYISKQFLIVQIDSENHILEESPDNRIVVCTF